MLVPEVNYLKWKQWKEDKDKYLTTWHFIPFTTSILKAFLGNVHIQENTYSQSLSPSTEPVHQQGIEHQACFWCSPLREGQGWRDLGVVSHGGPQDPRANPSATSQPMDSGWSTAIVWAWTCSFHEELFRFWTRINHSSLQERPTRD